MNRRNRLSLPAVSGLAGEVQKPVLTAPSSLYIPKAHLMEDRTLLHDFMEEFAFADLITASPCLRVTHLPVLLDREAGPFGTIRGHIARQNQQTAAFDRTLEALIVFRGPHGYISPSWYRTQPAVPTWNFAAVHATGKLTPVIEPKALYQLVAGLTAKFEDYQDTDYDFSKLPESYVDRMLSAIVGFEMAIERLEGKFKLGQDRPAADRQGILDHLPNARPERSLYDLTESFYRREG